MCDDNDIKIVGARPSETVKLHNAANKAQKDVNLSVNTAAAKKLGHAVADKFIKAGSTAFSDSEADDSYMMMQRLLLLSFTVTVGLERFCLDDTVAGVAQKAFLDKLRVSAPQLYNYTSDTGAFSFYFLAYRRGNDVVRRIGQTFAMLCSHDGDPIYQELGETLYCWFSSEIENEVKNQNLAK